MYTHPSLRAAHSFLFAGGGNKRGLPLSNPTTNLGAKALLKSIVSQVYATADRKRARQLLDNLARALERAYPGLRFATRETRANAHHNAPGSAGKPHASLSSTNLIENRFRQVRDLTRCVRRWQGGTMILRWTVAGVLQGDRRKVGYRSFAELEAALMTLHLLTASRPPR